MSNGQWLDKSGKWQDFSSKFPEAPRENLLKPIYMKTTPVGEAAFYGHMFGGQKAKVVHNSPHIGMTHVNPYPKNKKGVS